MCGPIPESSVTSPEPSDIEPTAAELRQEIAAIERMIAEQTPTPLDLQGELVRLRQKLAAKEAQ